MAEALATHDRPTSTAANAGPAGGDPPGLFDVWLHRCLQRRFKAVLLEPLPPDLLRAMGEADRPRPGDPGAGVR
jgi:hypothetical protein